MDLSHLNGDGPDFPTGKRKAAVNLNRRQFEPSKSGSPSRKRIRTSENREIGTRSRCRIRTHFTFPLIIGLNQARKQRSGIVLPLEKGWLPLEELPRPRVKPSLDAILASLGPIKTIGQRIRYHRVKNRLKQEDLGKRLGVGKTAVCQWEQGQTSPRKEFIKPLSAALGVSF